LFAQRLNVEVAIRVDPFLVGLTAMAQISRRQLGSQRKIRKM